jgi:predicted RND superfamily exporter protein
MLIKLGSFVQKFHKAILVTSLVMTVIMGFFMSKLKLNMQFMDILPKTEKTVIEYKNAMKNFDTLDSIVVAVKGNEEDIKKFMKESAEGIKDIEGIIGVTYENEVDFLEKNSLLLMKEKDMKNIEGAFVASNLKDFFAGINDNFEKNYIDNSDDEKLDKDRMKLLNSLNILEELLFKIKDGSISIEDAKRFVRGDRYMISPDKKMGILIVKSGVSINDFDNVIKVVNRLEKYLSIEGEKQNVQVGMTGLQVLSRDEMVVSQRDMEISSTASIILILIIFLISFRAIRYSLLALIPLISGIIWAMGITYLTIGSLNMMTAMMGAILIGLGIDYSIHIISLFLEERNHGKGIEESVSAIYTKTMKGVVTGGVTTTIGFLMFAFSDFPGFREFGLVLGIGILSTLLSAFFVLPSLLILLGGSYKTKKMKKISILQRVEYVIIVRKKSSLLIITIILIILSIKAGKVEFENDLLKIEPKNLESIMLNREIIDKFDFSSDNTIIVSKSLKEAQDTFDKSDKLKTIGVISSITDYLPSKEKQITRISMANNLKEKLKYTPDTEIQQEKLEEELFRLENNLIELADLAYIGGEDRLRKRCDEIVESGVIGDLAGNIPLYRDNLEFSQKVFIGELQNIIRNSNTIKILTINDLPQKIRGNYIGKDGTYITTFYPKQDLWKSDFQKIHMKEINTLGENITGSAKIFLKVIEKSASEGKKVLLFTVGAIYLVLIGDFRSIKYATASILPMLFSVLATLGVMGWTGFKFNMVNIIGLPLIIGIGVDDGVHIIHRYLREGNIYKALRSTGKAVTLTTITTIAAFGTLMFARYRGFVHFGIVLVMGVGFAYLFTVTFLISLISIVDRIEDKNGE